MDTHTYTGKDNLRASSSSLSRVWPQTSQGRDVSPSYLLPVPVPPGDPASAVPTVFDLVHGGELNAMAPRMAPLGPHQSDKV